MLQKSAILSNSQRSAPTVLLVGATSQLGWELRRTLRSLGTLHLTARNTAELPDCDRVYTVDLTDVECLRGIVREVQPQLIVNAAAYTAVDKAESAVNAAYAVNAEAPAVLAEEAKRLSAALVHYSTDYVYDGTGTQPYVETHRTAPLGVYGASKLAGETGIVTSGVAHLIFRTSWVYGIHGHNFVRTMLRLGGEREQISVVNDQVGAPNSARVLADMTAQVLAQTCGDFTGFCQNKGGVYHLSCTGETSWHGFAEEVFRLARSLGRELSVQTVRPIATSEYPTPARRPANSRLCVDRLCEAFHVYPPHWREALADSLPQLAASVPTPVAVA